MKKIVYHLQRKRCPKCKKLISARPPGVLAKCLCSNQLPAYVAVQHYIYGNTLGRIEKQTGIGYSGLVEALTPQLTKAISLRTLDIPDKQFKRQAAKIKNEIINITNSRARYPAIWKIRDIFREKAGRLYHWAGDRTIIAEKAEIDPYTAVFTFDTS